MPLGAGLAEHCLASFDEFLLGFFTGEVAFLDGGFDPALVLDVAPLLRLEVVLSSMTERVHHDFRLIEGELTGLDGGAKFPFDGFEVLRVDHAKRK